jgi:prophage regulatory protein
MKMFKAQPDLPMDNASSPSHPSDDGGAALLLRIATVVRITGLGRSTIYRLMADDRFPAPVRVTSRLVAWRRADLLRWSEAKRPVSYAALHGASVFEHPRMRHGSQHELSDRAAAPNSSD